MYVHWHSNPPKLEADALESLESRVFSEALVGYDRSFKNQCALPIELRKLGLQHDNTQEVMNNWRTWKIKYKKQIDHVVGYEEAFVDKILSQIPEISISRNLMSFFNGTTNSSQGQ